METDKTKTDFKEKTQTLLIFTVRTRTSRQKNRNGYTYVRKSVL